MLRSSLIDGGYACAFLTVNRAEAAMLGWFS
jgi:hypothetical protein